MDMSTKPAPAGRETPRAQARRWLWFVGLWAASAAATIVVAYALRLVIFSLPPF